MAYHLDPTKDSIQFWHASTGEYRYLVIGPGFAIANMTIQPDLSGLPSSSNSPDAYLLDRANHTGTQSAATLTDGVTNKVFTSQERTKLSGVATAATANATDAQLRDRSTHTGTQNAATVSDFASAAQSANAAALALKSDTTHLHAGVYAPVAHNHDATYAVIAHNHDLVYAALAHTHAGVYALVNHNHDAAYAAISHTHVKGEVGLGSVDNTSDAAKPVSTATQTALNAKATAGAALTEAAEGSSATVAGATSTALGSGIRVFAFFTLPTTEKWYVITGIEWKNMATVNGNVWCGVERMDVNPPVLVGTVNVATGARLVQTGANAVQRNSQIASQPIRGGTILGVWFVSDSATATFGNAAVTSANNRKTLAAGSPALADVTAWTASTAGYYVKAYFRGIV